MTITDLPENGRNMTALCADLLITFGATQLHPSYFCLKWQNTTLNSYQDLYDLITQIFIAAKLNTNIGRRLDDQHRYIYIRFIARMKIAVTGSSVLQNW